MKIQYQDKNLIILESELYRTTTSIIVEKDYILLVDPNWLPREIEYIHKKIAQIQENKKKYLIFTHSDYDHIIGYGKFKDYKTIASKDFVENENKNQSIQHIKEFDDYYYIQRNYEIIYPKIDISIEKDCNLKIGEDSYHFYLASGHTKDSLIIFNQSKGILIAGDYLSNIEFPYIYYSSRDYKNTLQTFTKIIHTEKVKTLVPGHGDFTDNSQEINRRIQESSQYIDELEQSILKNTEFDVEKLLKKFSFPLVMKNYHEANVLLMKKELLKDTST